MPQERPAERTDGIGGDPAARPDSYSADVAEQADGIGADPAVRADGGSAGPAMRAEYSRPHFRTSRLLAVQAELGELVGPSGRFCPALGRPNQARLLNLNRNCLSGCVADGFRALMESVRLCARREGRVL